MLLFLNQCNRSEIQEFNIHEKAPYAVCYTKVSPELVSPYQMVIIEPDFYTSEEMSALVETGTDIIAYLSMGEVDPSRWYYPKLQLRGFAGVNSNWNSAYLKLDDPETQKIILTEIIPQIMDKGAKGLFLDTIDSVSPETERGEFAPHLAELIRKIRKKYPDIIIIQNAGLFLLDETSNYVDAFMTESLASNYDFEKRMYEIRTYDEFKERLRILNEYSQRTNKPYFILEYTNDDSTRVAIKNQLDSLNRPYFISDIGLSRLPKNALKAANEIDPIE